LAPAPSVSTHKPQYFSAIGYVFEAFDVERQQRVAVKRTTKACDKVSREFEVLEKIRGSDNCIKMLDIYYSVMDTGKKVQNIVFEYCDQNLEDVIQSAKAKNEPIPMEQIKDFMRQILTGMDYVHAKNICHRDLKPENILMNEQGVVKICDFGSAKELTPNGLNTPYIVSRYYRAPELTLACTDYTNKIDIWGKFPSF
jgi:serine/threonine protein kinase